MSSSNIKNPQLKDLDNKLKDLRKNKVGSKTDSQAFKSAHIGWRMVLELVIGIIIGVISLTLLVFSRIVTLESPIL